MTLLPIPPSIPPWPVATVLSFFLLTRSPSLLVSTIFVRERCERRFRRSTRRLVLSAVLGTRTVGQNSRIYKGKSLLVVRVSRLTGELVNSKPCQNCLNTMKKMGIAVVYFSNNDGEIEKFKVSDLDDCYETWFQHECK